MKADILIYLFYFSGLLAKQMSKSGIKEMKCWRLWSLKKKQNEQEKSISQKQQQLAL